ncbi:MAG: hypothetical protein F4Y03_02595 [Alphaproteobacteria bacterium]|nr:hypothetical protein [Alphaproteobacteria bacterium]
MDHMKRTMAALARIRSAVANLVSGGELEAAKAAAAKATADLDEANREKEQIVGALEALADEIAPASPADPPDPDPVSEAPADTKDETQTDQG